STAGAFWDLDDADITFNNGAIVTIDDWENKDVNTFTFNLGSSGFSTLTPNNFFIGNGFTHNPGSIANATYNVDMASYTGGNNVITLVDYVSDFAGMNDATFQGAGGLNVLNPGANSGAIYWDNVAEAIRLNVNQT
ncbi:MAG: hypothetical protein GTO26_02020, partial [Planctomycetales bacterium]|nr:hypothetical protein [Planctomycetales bacterium]